MTVKKYISIGSNIHSSNIDQILNIEQIRTCSSVGIKLEQVIFGFKQTDIELSRIIVTLIFIKYWTDIGSTFSKNLNKQLKNGYENVEQVSW